MDSKIIETAFNQLKEQNELLKQQNRMLKSKLSKYSRIYKNDIEMIEMKELKSSSLNTARIQRQTDLEPVQEDQTYHDLDIQNDRFSQIEFHLRTALNDKTISNKLSQLEKTVLDRLSIAEKQRNKTIKRIENKINNCCNNLKSTNSHKKAK